MSDKLLSRPILVAKAVWLLYISMAISLAQSLFLTALTPLRQPLSQFLFLLGLHLLWWGIIVLISRGYDWARILFLFLMLLAIPFFLYDLLQIYAGSLIWTIIPLVHLVLQFAALFLLLQPEASEWFRGPRVVP